MRGKADEVTYAYDTCSRESFWSCEDLSQDQQMSFVTSLPRYFIQVICIYTYDSLVDSRNQYFFRNPNKTSFSFDSLELSFDSFFFINTFYNGMRCILEKSTLFYIIRDFFKTKYRLTFYQRKNKRSLDKNVCVFFWLNVQRSTSLKI